VLAQQVKEVDGNVVARLSGTARDILRADDVDSVYFQISGPRGDIVDGDRDLPLPNPEDAERSGRVHFRTETLHGAPVRIAYAWVNLQPLLDATQEPRLALVQVAETLDKRARLATEIIKGVILPQFVILPVAVLLVWLALARGIAPLHDLQQRIRRRDSGDLSPIDEYAAPEEVSPLVRAINDLLARLDQSLRAQKHFLADAAHQLKTPLAGLHTQAELAQREIDAGQHDPRALRDSLQQIARSSQNAAHMVNQLLAMARAEDEQQNAHLEPVGLAALAVETVRDFVPRALEKRIDLGYEGPGAAVAHGVPPPPTPWVRGNPVLLRELVRNLVDNALQYTPERGTVTVRVMQDPYGQVVVLQVEDSGPGIAPAEREQVFHPFYRALGTNVDGSGLGLAIVREIASRHGVEVTLEDAQPRLRGVAALAGGIGPGARFTLRFRAVADERQGQAGSGSTPHPQPSAAVAPVLAITRTTV